MSRDRNLESAVETIAELRRNLGELLHYASQAVEGWKRDPGIGIDGITEGILSEGARALYWINQLENALWDARNGAGKKESEVVQ